MRSMARPPQYGEGIAAEHCSNCRFFSETSKRSGECTRYKTTVGWDKWCKAWASKSPRGDTKAMWAEHRKALKEAS